VFKRSAEKLRDLVAAKNPEILMTIEQDNTCRGFEVFVDDVAIVSLLDMPRPFVKLRALDLDAVADEICRR
jgi:hypothetical protein